MAKNLSPMAKIIPYGQAARSLSITEKIGQCFMPAAFINDSEEEVQRLERLIGEHNIGSICFFHSRASAATNFEGKKRVVHNENSYNRLVVLIERYQKAAKYPLLIAIDAEWGLAMRIENTPQYPYALTLGAMQHRADIVFQVGKHIGLDCQRAGIHWNLAPCVDINLNPDNPVIGYRSFGQDRKQVTTYAKAYLDGMAEVGVLNAIKHFPGHGDTDIDSHLGLPIIEKAIDTLVEQELYPFVQLTTTGVDAIMVGHLAVPALANGKTTSASVSKEIITNFLRKELKYTDLIISDALNMRAVSKSFPSKGDVELEAFKAGNDILCFADGIEEGIDKILHQCSAERIEESFRRIWSLKEKVFNSANELKYAKDNEADLNKIIAQESLTIIKGDRKSIEKIREEGCQLLEVGRKSKSTFAKHVETFLKFGANQLLAIHPRQVKPQNNFGFSNEEVQKINDGLDVGNAAIYLFGSPFVLNVLDWKKAKVIVVAYQDFEVFQETAAHHFLGKIRAKGKLPIRLK